MTLLSQYSEIVGATVVDQLYQLAENLKGLRIVHVNSTREGGGVAEILNRLIPLQKELGLDASWEIITGSPDFYQCTKRFHNGMQGNQVELSSHLISVYEKTNMACAERLEDTLRYADIVFIHDPQPAPLLNMIPDRRGKWIWRCHIDVSRPYRPLWKYLRRFVAGYDASIWSLAAFAQSLPHPMYLVPPSIDPLSDKNRELNWMEMESVYQDWGIDASRPVITQVSRFDRFKDPVGVIQAYRLIRKYYPVQLILAGGGASDDPEGKDVLREVLETAGDDPDIHVLNLPADSNVIINAIQRISDIVVQKSVREGFGLTVTEAMWKGKPVIGGDTGGIRLQVINHHTGFLVNSPEGAALRIRYLLKHRDKLTEMGDKAKRFVQENFLLTRHLREYLTLMLAILHGVEERIEL